MFPLTLVTYCAEPHIKWIPSWAQQLNNQTYQDFQILFIGHNWDCTDIEAKIMVGDHLNEKLRPRIVVTTYYSPPIIGHPINFAIDIIQQRDYMAFFDVDDLMNPQRLELQMAYAQAHPEIDFVNGRMVGFYSDKVPEWDYVEPNEPYFGIADHEDIKKVLLSNGNCLGHGAMLCKIGALRNVGFSLSSVKTNGISPDWQTWVWAIQKGYKFHKIQDLVCLWRLDSSVCRA